MATSATLEGWQPVTPTFYAQPVLDESAVNGICGAELPDGRGILVWSQYGTAARFAVTPSTAEFLVDDSVPAADMADLVLGAVRATSCYVIDGEVYATVVTFDGATTTTRIYQADDPADPYLGWSIAATLQDDLTPGSRFGMEDWGAGIPLVLDSGRWVFVQGCWQFGIGAGSAASGANSAAWTSDGGAAGPWTLRNQYRHVFFFSRIEFCSAQLASDPATGFLYYSTATGAGGPDFGCVLWESQDDGATWGLHGQPSPGSWGNNHRLSAIVDNSTDVFAFGGAIGGANEWGNVLQRTGDATNVQRVGGGWTDTGEDWVPYVTGHHLSRKAVVASQGVFFFEQDRVMFVGGGGWLVGEVPIGRASGLH